MTTKTQILKIFYLFTIIIFNCFKYVNTKKYIHPATLRWVPTNPYNKGMIQKKDVTEF